MKSKRETFLGLCEMHDDQGKVGFETRRIKAKLHRSKITPKSNSAAPDQQDPVRQSNT